MRSDDHRRRRPGAATTLLTLIALALALAACAPRSIGDDARRVDVSDAVAGSAGAQGTVAGARPSDGCAAAGASPLPTSLRLDGRERTLVSVAPSAPRTGAADLVIAFHGRTNDAARASRYFDLDAAMPAAYLVFPQALPVVPGSFAWADPGDAVGEQRDFELVAAVIDAFATSRCIDLDRVFVVGHSLGAYFANDVACQRGRLVRAVASVAGGVQGDDCAGAIAALVMHHPDDHLVPVAHGERARDAFLAAKRGEATSPEAIAGGPLAALGCVRHGAGDHDPAPVVWCEHDRATVRAGRVDPHGWPDVAAEAIATFFASLP